MQPGLETAPLQGVALLEHAARPDGMDSAGYRGRVAPSPTGLLHVGHARTFWAAAQRVESARAQGHSATLVMRVDDMDGARSKAEFVEAGYEDLRWLGISWQEGPDIGGQFAPYVQSQRMDSYRAALEVLKSKGMVYPCCCSRKDITAALSAPHQGEEEPVYPGTCRPCFTPKGSTEPQQSRHLDSDPATGHPAEAEAGHCAHNGMVGDGLEMSAQAGPQSGGVQQGNEMEGAVAGANCSPAAHQGPALACEDCGQPVGTQQTQAEGPACHSAVPVEPAKAQPELQPAVSESEPASDPLHSADRRRSQSEAQVAADGADSALPHERLDTSATGLNTDAVQPPTHDEAWHASHSTAHAGQVADHSKALSSSKARQQLKAARRAEREAKQAQAREARLAKQRQQSSTCVARDSSGTPANSKGPLAVSQATIKWSWRFRVPEDGTIVRFKDNCLGVQEFVVGKDFGDFVVWRHDDLPAYQLACVVDDAMMHITEVVRGADLLVSTARQLLLAWALGYDSIPAYYHCPLVCDADNKRLAKRSDAMSIRALRTAGKLPEEVLNGNVADLLSRPA